MIIDSGTEKSRDIRKRFEAFLSSSFIDELENSEDAIVFGGDGTLIYNANKFGLGRTYLPINGGSLGFLMNDVDDLAEAASMIESSKFNVREFITLKAKLQNGDREYQDVAINDVYMERASGQAAKLTILIDGRNIVEKMVCDGIIVSSPLGSTGYNRSAGGSICLPSSEVLQITPICAHHPALPPIIVPITSEIKIYSEEKEKRPVRAVVDGRSYSEISNVTVNINSDNLKLAYFEGNDFTDRLINKIIKKGN